MNTLRSWWRNTQRAAHAIGDFQARVILTVLYAIFVVPVGLFLRANDDTLGMRRKQDEASHWQPHESHAADVRAARRQF